MRKALDNLIKHHECSHVVKYPHLASVDLPNLNFHHIASNHQENIKQMIGNSIDNDPQFLCMFDHIAINEGFTQKEIK